MKNFRYIDNTAILKLNKEICIGCGNCVEACPYGVRWLHPGVQAPMKKSKQAAAKCTFCMHRVEQGLLPACVNVCEGKARIFGEIIGYGFSSLSAT